MHRDHRTLDLTLPVLTGWVVGWIALGPTGAIIAALAAGVIAVVVR